MLSFFSALCELCKRIQFENTMTNSFGEKNVTNKYLNVHGLAADIYLALESSTLEPVTFVHHIYVSFEDGTIVNLKNNTRIQDRFMR